MENQPKKHLSQWIAWSIILLVAGSAGFAVWFYWNDVDTIASNINITAIKKTDNADKVASETATWKTLNLSVDGGLLKYPNDWIVESTQGQEAGITAYTINKGNLNSDVYINLFDINEWIKGPSPEEPYVLTKEKRQIAVDLMKDIFDKQKITPEAEKIFTGLGVEFFAYSNEDAAGLTYIASADNKSRGFSVIGTHGQDLGVMAQYVTTLFNKDKNIIVSVQYTAAAKDSSELKVYQDKLNAIWNTDPSMNSEAVKVDDQNHKDFIDLIASTSREKLSFGPLMNKIDLVAKTLKFK